MKINKHNPNHISAIFQSKMVSEISPGDLENRILDLVTKASIRMGVNISEEGMVFQVKDLCYILRKNFKIIRIDELDTIFEDGALGNYGNNYGKLEVDTMNRWIKHYMANERAKQFLKDEEKNKEASPMCEKIRLIKRNIDKIPFLKKLINSEIDQTQ